MKTSEIRELNTDELQEKLNELKKRLFELRSQSVTEKIEDTCAISNLKKDIARIKTIIRESQLKAK